MEKEINMLNYKDLKKLNVLGPNYVKTSMGKTDLRSIDI